MHAIPKKWKDIFKQNLDTGEDRIYLNTHLRKRNRLPCPEKINSKELYIQCCYPHYRISYTYYQD